MYTIDLKEDFYTTFLTAYEDVSVEMLENTLSDKGIFHLSLLLYHTHHLLSIISLDLPQAVIPILTKYDFNVFSLKEILESHNLKAEAPSFEVVSLAENLKALFPYDIGNKALRKCSFIYLNTGSSYKINEYFLTDINQMRFIIQ